MQVAGNASFVRVDTRGLEALRTWLDRFWDAGFSRSRLQPNEKQPRRGHDRDRKDSGHTLPGEPHFGMLTLALGAPPTSAGRTASTPKSLVTAVVT